MIWQIALSFNIVFGTLRSYLDKKLVSKIDPLVVYFFVVLWDMIFLFLYYFLQNKSLPPVFPEMMAMGALYTIVVSCYLAAIKINLSQTAVFLSYYLVIPLILSAAFLGEWSYFDPSSFLGQKTILGIVLAFISIFLLLRSHSKKEVRMEREWVILILVNILLNGVGTYWGKTFVNTHSVYDTLFSPCLGGLAMVLVINFFAKKKYFMPISSHLLAVLDGLVIGVAVAFYYLALKLGPLALVLPAQSLLLTITLAIVGLVVFREAQHFDTEKKLGLILGILGVAMLLI